MLEINVLNVTDSVLIVSGVINLILGFLVLTRGIKKPVNASYFLISVGVFTWVINLVLFDSFRFGDAVAFWFAIVAYVGALFIPIASLYFASYFGAKTVHNTHVLHAFSLLFLIFAGITLVPGLVIENVSRAGGISIMTYGPLYVPYALYIGSTFAVTFFYLCKRHYNASGRIKLQLRYVFLGTISTAGISLVTNLVLPYYGNFSLFMVGPTTVVIMAIFVGYAIMKYGLWDFRKIFAEILIGILVILSLANIVISQDYFSHAVILWFKMVVIVVTILVALILLNSFKKEQKSKRKLKRLNKKLKDVDEKKTEFLHIATHQLRGPVAAINGYASLLRDGDYGKLGKAQVEPLQKILASSKVMTDTINDYMDIARIEEENFTLEQADFKLCKLIQERAEIFRGSAEKKGIQFVVKKTVGKACTVHADKKNITQVINALLENAIKYTIKGTVTVHAERSVDGTQAIVHVSDSGIGVPKSELDGLFTKFSRASNAEESSVGGTGMGLFIAKSLMEANGGSISVASEGLNKGTTFTIELPLVRA